MEENLVAKWTYDSPDSVELVNKYTKDLKYQFTYGGALVGFTTWEKMDFGLELENVLILQEGEYYFYRMVFLVDGLLVYPIS